MVMIMKWSYFHGFNKRLITFPPSKLPTELMFCNSLTLAFHIKLLPYVHLGCAFVFSQSALLSTEILGDIFDMLCDPSIPEAQRHAAGTIRNLSVGDHVKVRQFTNIHITFFNM